MSFDCMLLWAVSFGCGVASGAVALLCVLLLTVKKQPPMPCPKCGEIDEWFERR